MKQLTILLVLFIVAKGAFSQTIYIADYKTSSIQWKGFKPGGEHIGTINIVTGTLVFDEEKIASGSFIFDMRNLSVDDMEDIDDRVALLKELMNESFFNCNDYSISLFEIKKGEKIDNEDYNYQITGNLTIKEITKEITFPAKIVLDENKLLGEAKIVFNRQEWELEMSNFIKDFALNNNIELNVSLKANKK
jgi:polyisoprenoid-binding protein YceI